MSVCVGVGLSAGVDVGVGVGVTLYIQSVVLYQTRPHWTTLRYLDIVALVFYLCMISK